MAVSSLLNSPLAQALRGSPLPPLRKLTLEETDQEVILSGRVSSYYLKQLAQETVMPLLGGRVLNNHIQVVRN